MKKLQTVEVKKYVMEFQWWRDENSNEMSSAFHENNNESPQLTEDFTLGTSLTAIVKPTIRTSETWETVKAKDGTLIECLCAGSLNFRNNVELMKIPY